MLLKIVLLFVSIFLLDVKSDIADETEDRLLKFRDDVNQISVDFENFVYDIVKEILSSTDMHYLNPFSEARLKQNVLKAMKLPTKTVFGKKYFADITTPTMPLQLLQKMSTTTPKNVLENYWNDYLERSSNLFSKAGLKRIRRDTNDPKTVEGKMTEVNDCSTKTQQQQILERQHIQDLKEEVQKLRDLVVLLKSQQKLISVLDANNDTSPTEIDSKDLLDVLNDIDAKSDAGKPEEKDKDDHADSIKNQTEPRPTHDELERIKYDLRQTIAALNKTKDILTAEKDHEIKFENELNRQRKELNFLKFMVQQLYNKSYFTDNSSEIVGATIAHRPLELPVLKNRNITRESAMSSKRLNTHQTRANDLENLLKELDSSSDISRLQQEIDKKKREENIRKLLEKVMEQKESKALDQTDDTSSLLKKLQKSLHPPSRPQSKVDDVDVESELKRLENAINFMRPNNNLDLSDDPTRELEKLRELLDGIDRQGGGSLPIGGGPGSNKGLSPQQILALRRRLEMMSHGIAGNGFSSVNNDLTYGGQNIDANRRGFLPYQYPPYMDTYGNIAPTYPGYPTDPYRPGGFNNFYNPQSNGYPPHVPPNLYQNGNPAQFSGGFSTNLDNFDYRGKPFGGTAPYTETYSKPNDVNAPTYDFSKYYGGGSGASQSSYSKPSGDSQKPLPYSQALPGNPNNPGYASSDATNQFFPAPQPNNYDKSSGNGVYNAENADRGNPSQPGTYLPKNPFGGDYKSKNIEELKTQVNSLQNVINGLNYSGYAKKPEDQQTINNLEQQINELKGIINSLNQDAPTNQQTYNQAPPTYEQPSPIQQNYPPSNRRRRSVENHSVADLFEQITSKLKEYLFSTDGNEERTPYTNIQQRISNVKSQKTPRVAT